LGAGILLARSGAALDRLQAQHRRARSSTLQPNPTSWPRSGKLNLLEPQQGGGFQLTTESVISPYGKK